MAAIGISVKANEYLWSGYLKQNNGKLFYDKASSHSHDDAVNGSPAGTQLCLFLVDAIFASEALVRFPDTVEELTEAQVAKFWEERVTLRQPSELMDVAVLQGLAAKKALGIPFSKEQKRMMDPKEPEPGLRINAIKKWSGNRDSRGLKIVQIRKRAKKPPTA